ncbi:hypothetical protein D0B54_15245 [Solimonas sp. K1W22B-7]|uniref:hypothetical protein n=1 Tax=Solimonas sp. K1W22B-7 TaxID=2303331 RepID=UPI000E336B4E|nr:hypothetical protein [Solimonas sp. K1W22B-7]AXQ31751.1 hypothetical protein D0B54_15245 [Solimonas sp. K1W22B-7]
MLTLKLSLGSGLLMLPLFLLAGAALAQLPLPADYDENGQVDRSEWREGAAARFRAADRNSDGYLDAAEQKQLMPRHFVMRLGRAEGAPAAGDKLKTHGLPLPPAPKDTNGDGYLDQAEVLAQADQAFVKMDRDGNGVLEAEEVMPPPPALPL